MVNFLGVACMYPMPGIFNSFYNGMAKMAVY